MANRQEGTEGKAPKIFGRQVYEATLIVKGKKKTSEKQINFSIGHGEVEVYSTDWKSCLYGVPIDKTKAEPKENNVIRFAFSRGDAADQVIEFFVRFERVDAILAAFNPPTLDKAKEGNTMSILDLPAALCFGCSLNEQLAQASFRPHLEAQARKRLLFLTSSNQISDSLLMAIACEFRMRFPQIEPENWTEAFDVLWFEFVAFCVSLWTQCLKTAIEPHTGPNSFEYFRRLTASIAGLIARGADVFGVERKSILSAARKFIDLGDPSDIPAASRAIVSEVELALGNVRKRWLLQLCDLFEFTQVYTTGISIAQSLNGETKDSIYMAQVICAWSNSLVNNLIRPPRMIDFKLGLEKLAVGILKANDSNRYGPDFHCTMALWKLSELVKTTE